MAAAGAGVTKGARRGAEVGARFPAVGVHGVAHEAGGESGFAVQYAVGTLGEGGGHPVEGGRLEEAPPFPHAAAGEQGVEFRQTARGADTAERAEGGGAGLGRVHGGHAVQAAGGGKGADGERAGRGEGGVEGVAFGRGGLGRENGGRLGEAFGREADPHVEGERLGEVCAPVVAEGGRGEPAEEFIHEIAEGARVVAVPLAERPGGSLRGKGVGHGRVVLRVRRVRERGEPGLMREQFRDRHPVFPGLRKLRPHLGHGRERRDAMLLAGVQQTRGGQPFRRRPKQHGRLRAPRLRFRAVAETARERQHFASFVPHAHRRAEFTEGGEIFVEERGKVFGVHRSTACHPEKSNARL